MPNHNELECLYHKCMPFFIALGDEVRLDIIEILTRALHEGNSKGLNVNEITRQMKLSRPAVSHHLKILKEAGLVEVKQNGTSNYYRATMSDCTRQLMELGRVAEQFYNQT